MITVGLGKYKMEIDIAAETKKMQKQARKVGDKSGVGCGAQPSKQDDDSNKHHHHRKKKHHKGIEENREGPSSSTKQMKMGSLYDQKVMREAELLLNGRADEIPQLEAEFKQKIGS